MSEETSEPESDESGEPNYQALAQVAPVGIFRTDAAGECVYVNEKLCELSGLDARASLGKGWIAGIHPDDRERVMAEWRSSVMTGEPLKSECRFLSDRGVVTWVLAQARPITDRAGSFAGYAGTVTDITDRKRMEAELQERYDDLQLLHSINQTILNFLEAGPMFDDILDKALKIGAFDIGAIRLLDPNSGNLKPLAVRGFRDPETVGNLHTAFSDNGNARDPVIRRALTERTAVIIEDLQSCDALRLLKKEGVRSVIFLPIKTEDQFIGVLQLGSRAPRKFPPGEVRLLEAVGNQTGIAVQKVRLFSAAAQGREHAEALRAIGIALTATKDPQQVLQLVAEESRRLTGGLFAFVATSDKPYYRIAAVAGEDKGYREILKLSDDPDSPFGRGPLGKAVRERRAVVCEDVMSDPDFIAWRDIAAACGIRSLVAAPIVIQGSPFGALLTYAPLPKAYDGETIALLTSLAAQAAAALESARLLQEAEQRAREQAALSAIATATNQSLDIDEVLRVSLRNVIEITGRELAYIRLKDSATARLQVVAHEGLSAPALDKLNRSRISGIGEKVLASGESVVVNASAGRVLGAAMPEHERFAIGWFPLKIQGECVGILNVASAGVRPFSESEVKLLQAVANVIGVAIGNARLYAVAQRNLARLRALHEIDSAILSSTDHEAVLKVLLEKIDLFLSYACATIRMWNPDTRSLEPVVCHKLDEAAWKQEAPGAGWGPASATFQSGAPVILEDCRTDARVYGQEFFRKHGLVSYLGVPLIAQDKTLGVISFYTVEEHEFTAEEVEFVKTLAGQAAVAVERSMLYRDLINREAQLQVTHKQLEALHSVTVKASQSLDLETITQSVIDKITEIFDFDATRFYLYDEKTDELRVKGHFEKNPELFHGIKSFRRGQGNVGLVAETGAPLIFEDVSADPLYQKTSSTQSSKNGGHKFFAALPIKASGRVLGTMVCMGLEARRLSEGEIQLLMAMVGQVAVAVENGSLYEEIKKRADELQRKTWELEAANRVKTEFLSVMSHELRTPLSVVMGYAGMLKEGMLGALNPRQADALKKMLARAGDQLSMINDIMQTTQLEAGAVIPERREVDVSQVLNQLKGECLEALEGKNVKLAWNCPAEPLRAVTDGAKLKQALHNVITNAVKFTNEGSIAVSARLLENRQIELSVVDTGVGIAAEKLPVIFEKFRQGDSSETRIYGGIGLGLYIARQLLDLLGGRIDVESELGKGTTFTITIPLDNGGMLPAPRGVSGHEQDGCRQPAAA